MQRTRARFAFAFVALLFAGSGCEDNDNLRTDVLLCESAVAHLKECCGTTPDISCTYAYKDPSPLCISEGCDPATETFPDLHEADSENIRNASCASLVAQGACKNGGSR